MQKTTRAYPYTREEAVAAIADAIQRHGPNHAEHGEGRYSYRDDGHVENVVAFSFVESPRTPGAYKQIPYA